jgi:hypothetical protein
MAASAYRLKVSGVEAAEWLESISAAPPSLLPTWPESPDRAVVVASVGHGDSGEGEYRSVLVVCTRERLRDESAVDPLVRKLYFHVWRDQLIASSPALEDATFE